MATKRRPFHLVVFGASGFTGQFVTEEVAREQVDAQEGSRLPWAVAGRSREKLQQVLDRAALKLGRPTLPSEVEIIVCDISNPASLDEMAKQATVVLNCVGPYRFYGEPVIKACIENGASYVDICGEPQFLELMYWKYHEKAAEKGVYIIGSSGFDSIPADLGVIYTSNKINGTLTAVECFLTIHSGPEVQFAAYLTVGGITSVVKLMFAGLFFLFFVRFGIGRQLLIKFPWLFSFGYFSKQGPTQKQMDATSFTMMFFGQGYSQGCSPEASKPNVRICTQVKGPEAGYVATPIAMVQAAMTLLNDASDLPRAGGVFTPGAAFSRTKLIDRLHQRGIEFSVISSSEV
ncbi:saccharopine dehydrogenase-like oxidoreductase isoform X2 [Phyllostomus discolor]|uniref:Saccharopine dehydrogenase-like oxidoreductase n=1 Tax=Phyllostomus discolor TaxID=89673 RepID=A0A7E6CY66_9CHIR|nr:saccharopine dehydrogenase-like oxidoreductase isoform X2 [Phyllostomus discolor]